MKFYVLYCMKTMHKGTEKCLFNHLELRLRKGYNKWYNNKCQIFNLFLYTFLQSAHQCPLLILLKIFKS